MEISNKDIAHVGPGTPCGAWFRRFWLVVGTVGELYDIPQAVRVLGEDLVLFRDLEGRIGLIGQDCAHRGASLEYGDIEAAGIRCPYHGWLYDVSGRCLDQPSERQGKPFCDRVRQKAYPVKELGGLIFAYMGPNPETPPPLPRFSPLIERGGLHQIEPTRHFSYNWFNFYENSADPVHVWILHAASAYGAGTWGNGFFNSDDPPDFEPVEMPYGMKIVMSKPGPKPDIVFVDEMSLALPSILQIGDTEFVHAKIDPEEVVKSGSRFEHCMFLTPNDDHSFMLFTVDHYTGPDQDIFAKLAEMRKREEPKEEMRPYDKRPLMSFRGNIRKEDIVTQGTQKLLGERHEQLGSSDRGIIMIRRLVREGLQAVANGAEPKGLILEENDEGVVAFDSFVGVRANAKL